MSADIDQVISIGVNTPTSEVDIQMSPTDLCLPPAVFAMRKSKSKSKEKLETESNDLFRAFGGCNLEISVSTVLHAEAIALYKALSEGYTKIQAVGVTSDHEDQIKPLYGACRQLYLFP